MKSHKPLNYPFITLIFAFLVVFVVSNAVSPTAFGQEKSVGSRTVGPKRISKPKERDELEKRVARLSEDLDAAKQATRDQAEAELQALGPSAIEFLTTNTFRTIN